MKWQGNANGKARVKAKAAGKTFFTGKVCKHHPELLGQRRTLNANCPQCVRDRVKRNRMADPEAYRVRKDKERRRRRKMKASGTWVDLRRKSAGGKHVTI